MERVTETKLSLEALRQMKSHGRTASPTLIGAIEQIVNRAIETHLDEPFYSEAAPFLDYLGNRMSLTCEQTLVSPSSWSRAPTTGFRSAILPVWSDAVQSVSSR